MQEDKTNYQHEFAALIGLDWSDEKHDVMLYDPVKRKGSDMTVDNDPEALEKWVLKLRKKFNGKPIAICLEQSKGMLIYKLMGYNFITLYPINPAVSASYRETFFPSKAKDDPVDAQLMMELLVHHRDRLKPWRPDTEETRALAILNEDRRNMVEERKKLVQRLTATLKTYYPQGLNLCGQDLGSNLSCDFLMKWPSLNKLKSVKDQTLRSFYYGHNCRSEKLIAERLDVRKNAVAVTDEKLILESSELKIAAIARQIRDLNAAIAKYDRKIKELFLAHSDSEIFSSFPGAAAALSPRLLTAFGSDRDRFKKAENIQNYSGISPVTEKSGKSKWVHQRWRCPKFIRQTFHEFALHSTASSVWAKEYYEYKIKKGKDHHAVIRALAFKWQRIMFKCWETHTPYDEQKYIQSLRKKNSPYAPKIAA